MTTAGYGLSSLRRLTAAAYRSRRKPRGNLAAPGLHGKCPLTRR